MSKASFNQRTEQCPTCRRETPHTVSIQQRTEGPESDHPEFSREPYRVSECLQCGEQEEVRLNDVR